MLKRVAVRLAPWLVAVGTFVGLTYDRMVSDGFAQLERRRNDVIVLAHAAIANHLAALSGDMMLVARHPALADVLEASSDSKLDRLGRLLTLVMEVRGDYDQGRWIDETGQERVRCDRVFGLQDGNDVRCLPPGALVSKADRYYFTDAIRLDVGAMYVSPLDLNVEHGAVEVPDKPVLRLAMPLQDGVGQRRGILIFNALMQGLLEELRRLRSTVNINLYLVDESGNWLVGEKPGDAFAFQHGKPENTFFNRYPQTAAAMGAEQEEQFHNLEGAWHVDKFPLHDLVGLGSTRSSQNSFLWLVSHNTIEDLENIRRSALYRTLPLLILFAAIAFFFSYRYARLAKDRDLAAAAAVRQAEELARMNLALKEALAQGIAMRDELVDARKLSSLGLMVAGVAHELNTPVGAALMAATALKKSLESDVAMPDETFRDSRLHARLDAGLGLIQTNLNRIAERIARLRRLAVDRASVERRRFRLRDLAADVLHDVEHRMKRASVTVHIDISPEIELDNYPGPLGQILENLILNSAFHAFDQRVGRRIDLTAVPDGEHVLLTVSDNGKGIAAEHMPHLFDPFFTTKRNEQRMGLGLYLVKRFVTELIGGSLTVASEMGKGTKFMIFLPLIVDCAPTLASSTGEELSSS